VLKRGDSGMAGIFLGIDDLIELMMDIVF